MRLMGEVMKAIRSETSGFYVFSHPDEETRYEVADALDRLGYHVNVLKHSKMVVVKL